jgi:hypothetical protein
MFRPLEGGKSKEDDMAKEKTSHGDAVSSCSLIICFLIAILCCAGAIRCDTVSRNERVQAKIETMSSFLKANKGKVKVLWIYPQHGHKDTFVGHYAVVEGIIDKVRKEIHVGSSLPIPDEIWSVAVDGGGYYRFGHKTDEQ